MAVLVRKFSSAKWEQVPSLREGAISADAITADLRTSSNTLSFWECKSSERQELERPILALAAGFEEPEKLDVVWIEKDRLTPRGIQHCHTNGETPVASLRSLHVDLVELDYESLGQLAKLIREAHLSEHWRRVTKQEVVKLVAEAVRRKEVDPADLKERLRKAVEKSLNG